MKRITNEILEPVDLCLPDGRLNPAARGWSRVPRQNCNVNGPWLRRKRWDYWCVTGPDFLFSVTIADVDYALTGFVYFLEFASRRFIEHTVLIPFARSFAMPALPGGRLELAHKDLELNFDTDDAGRTTLVARARKFGGHRLDAKITIDRPPGQESMNVVIPWSDRRFQFTSKQPVLPARGSVRLDDTTYEFPEGVSFACLDYGRGVWPFATRWNWAAFSARAGSDRIGVNLGAKWTDGTGSTENAVFLNEKVFKIFDDLIFEYDPADFMKPWRIHAPDPADLDLRFTPFFERKAVTNLILLYTRVSQMIGRFEGTFRAGERVIRVDEATRATGWAEEHAARW